MQNDVKIALESQAGVGLASDARQYNSLWLLYFMLSIGGVGGLFAYVLATPFYLLEFLSNKAWRMGGEIMVVGVSTLLKVQPWLKATVKLEVPKGCVTISNHRSHLDMYFLLANISNVRALARSTLFKVPFLGFMMRRMKMIPVAGSIEGYWDAMERAKQAAIVEKDPVHVFPEMKRCSLGFKGVQAFHLAPFKMMKDLNLPVVPIVFKDTDQTWPKDIYGISFRKPIQVFSLPPLHPQDYPSADHLRTAAWESISKALE